MTKISSFDVAGYPAVSLFDMSLKDLQVKELTSTSAVISTPFGFEIRMTGNGLDIQVVPLPGGGFDFIGKGTVTGVTRTNIGGTVVFDAVTDLPNVPFSLPANPENLTTAFLKGVALSGDDVFVGNKDNNPVDGGGGRDVFVIAATRAEVTITTSGSETILTSHQGIDRLLNIEQVRFSDGATYDVVTGPPPAGRNLDTSYYPAAAISQVVMGANPTATQMEVRAKAAQGAYDYYANVLKVADPGLGPYESLGVSFSALDEFRGKYGTSATAVSGGGDAEFIARTYLGVFQRAATDAQQKHFTSQINYFVDLYQGAGIAAPTANMQARGAVLGQMVGFVMTSPNERAMATQQIDDKAIAFVSSLGLSGAISAAPDFV